MSGWLEVSGQRLQVRADPKGVRTRSSPETLGVYVAMGVARYDRFGTSPF